MKQTLVHRIGTMVCASFALMLVGVLTAAESDRVDAYLAHHIWTGDSGPIKDGVLLVRDGKILEVGPRAEVSIPDDAVVHDLGAQVIIPGLVIAESNLAESGKDDDASITPQVRAIDGFDFFTEHHEALAGGVTTVQIAPGSNRLVPGVGAVVKLAGKNLDARTLAEQESLRMLLTEAARKPPTIYKPPVGAVSEDRPLDPTRPQLASSLGGAVAGLRALFRAAREAEKQAAKDNDAATDADIQTVLSYMSDNKTIRISAAKAIEIRAALSLAREFDLRPILVDPSGITPSTAQNQGLKELLKGVIVNAGIRPGRISNPSVPEKDTPVSQPPWKSASDLINAGIKVAIRPASDADLPEMLFLAGLFTQSRLSTEDVLRMVTKSPAELLGVSDRVGTLVAGKDADFVVLNADPFSLHSQVASTYIAGVSVYDRKSQNKTTVIEAAAVYTGTGEVLHDSSVVVVGSSIRGLGHDVSAPLNAEVKRFKNAVVVPGFIDLATGLGVGGSLGSVSLQTKIGDQLYPDAPAVAIARQGGVTTVLLGASSSPSPVVAFKLGDDLRVLKDPVAIRFAISGNLTSAVPALKRTLTQGKAYADRWTKYEADLAEYESKNKKKAEPEAQSAASAKADFMARALAARKKAEAERKARSGETKVAPAKQAKKDDSKKDQAEKKDDPEPKETEKKEPPKPPTKPSVSAALEPYRALFGGQIPALVEARRSTHVQAALKLFHDDYGLKTIIVGANDIARDQDLLDKKNVAVSIGPQLVDVVDRQPANFAQIFANKGIPFGFQSGAKTGVKTLPRAVQFAVRKGLGSEDALNGLTSGPAKFLQLDSSIGSLSVGHDADLVVLSGPPFELSTKVLAVMVDGKWVYEEDSQ